MNYPAHEQPKNEWYMTTVPSKAEDGKFTSAWVQFRCCGFSTAHDFGSVTLDDPNFEVKWKALISAGKKKIDALNSPPEDGITEGNPCAECGELAEPGNYLCGGCKE